jgi:nitric oxide dioxygenase
MSLTDDEIDLIRVSFHDFARGGSGGGMLFYDRLFEIAPGLRSLFSGDVAAQGTKLMSMLGAIVAQLHDHDTLLPMVEDLARRHVAYGVQPPHYALVGEALLWALAKGLGTRFSPTVEAAWQHAYAALSGAMIEAAYPPMRSPAAVDA